MKTKSNKPATKQKQAVKLKDLKPKGNPKGGLRATSGDPEEEDPLIP